MQAGRLRHRLVVEQVSETQNSRGGVVQAWVPFVEVAAAIIPLRGVKLELARQQYATATHEIEMRYLSGVVSKMRGKFGSRILDFDGVLNEDERNHTIFIAATERALP